MMFGVYASPTAAFLRLKEKPVWLLPLVLAVIANMAVSLVSIQYVDWTETRQVAIDSMRQRNMTEDQINQALEGMDKFQSNGLLKYGVPLATSLVTSLVSVFFLALIYNVSLPLLGVTGNFMRTLSVIAVSGLVALPSALVRIPLTLLQKSAQVSTSLLVAAPNLKSPFLTIILSRIDLFAIWQLVLAGLGLKVVFDIRGTKSWWLVFSIWGVLTIVMALLGGAGRGGVTMGR
jgi:hypothetical protein